MSWDDGFGQAGPTGDLYAPITDALEHATDLYVEACNQTAVAENAYRLLHARAYVRSQVAITARDKACDALPEIADAKAAWRLAEAHERACKAKCDELRHRLMASMSWQRLVGGQT